MQNPQEHSRESSSENEKLAKGRRVFRENTVDSNLYEGVFSYRNRFLPLRYGAVFCLTRDL